MDLKLISKSNIETDLKLGNDLNYIGLNISENNTYCPLSYVIYTNEQEWFDKILESKNININLIDKDTQKAPICFALESNNPYYIEKLLEKKEIDIYPKIWGFNILFYTYKNNGITKLNSKVFEMFYEYINSNKDFNYELFFDKMDHIKAANVSTIVQMIDFLDEKYLKKILDNKCFESLGYKKEVDLIATYFFEMSFLNSFNLDRFVSLSKKILNILPVNDSFNNYNIFTDVMYSRIEPQGKEILAEMFLQKGFNPLLGHKIDGKLISPDMFLKDMNSKAYLKWNLEKDLTIGKDDIKKNKV